MFLLRPETQCLIANSFVYINLLNLRDGSPYSASPVDVITWELPPRVSGLMFPEVFVITGSRVVMYLFYQDPDLEDPRVWTICVWDWKTGNLVSTMSF